MRPDDTSLSHIVEHSVNEIYVFDAESLKFLYVNEAARINLGYSSKELSAMTPLDIKKAYKEESFRRLLSPLADDPSPTAKIQFETAHLRKDGTTYPVGVRLKQALYGGKPAYVAYILDTTTITHAKEALMESEAMLRLGQQIAQTGSFELDVATNTLRFSDEISNIFELDADRKDYSVSELLQFVHPDDLAKSKAIYESSLTDKTFYDLELKLLLKSGNIKTVRVRGKWYYDEHGAPIRHANTVQDISELKKYQTELLQIRYAIDSSPDSIYITDAEKLQFLFVNKTAATSLRYTQQELLQLGPQDIFKIDRAAISRMYDEAIAAGDTGTVNELKTTNKAGVKGIAEVRRRAFKLDDRWVIITVSHDISARKRAEKELAEAHAQLEQRIEERTLELRAEIKMRKQIADDLKISEAAAIKALEIARKASRAKSEFLTSMSHELRTPMNAILGFAELMMLDRKSPLSPMQQEYMESIFASGRQLLELIDGVLQLGTSDQDAESLNLGPVSTSEVFKDCLEEFADEAAKRNITLIKQCQQESAQPDLHSDKEQLKKVLNLLMSNAIKYNREGGTVTINCDNSRKHRIRINVIDTGPGIPKPNHTRLFQPFERLGRETGKIGGAGIGLSTAKHIVEILRGEIGFSSEEGKGSTFWIELPLHSVESTLDSSFRVEAL